MSNIVIQGDAIGVASITCVADANIEESCLVLMPVTPSCVGAIHASLGSGVLL